MVSAANDVSHPFIRIVHNNGEVKNGFVKGTGNDEITKVIYAGCYLTANNIDKCNCSARISKTNNFFSIARVFRYLF